MKVLKGIALALLSFVLFLCLSAFGAALVVNGAVLNRHFVPNELDKLNIGELTSESLSSQTDLTPKAREVLVGAISSLEPQLKTQLRAANSQIYDYLQGRTGSIDLHGIIKATVLSQGFVNSVANDPGVLSFARQSLRDELVRYIPAVLPQLTVYLDQAMPALDPWLGQQINAASGPIVDYFVGDRSTLRLVISLDQMKATLKTNARAAFLKSPPSQLAGASQAQLDSVFNQYYDVFASQVPASVVIDQSSLGLGASSSMADAIASTQNGLENAKKALDHFRFYFVLLIVSILLLIAAIALIHHQIKGASRDLGITFLVYGITEGIGVAIGGFFVGRASMTSIPAALEAWLPHLYWDALRPLLVFSIVMAIVGVGLLVVSFVDRRKAA